MQLKGVYTALVTPFKNSAVDLEKLRELTERQIEAGISGLVPVGTTGESPTLSVDEHAKVIETVIKTAAGRCPVIAGTGANSTAEAIHLTKAAKDAGADASLQVTPYYNKPTQEGLYRHFASVAEEGGLPIVLYNIPGRSGVPIDIETIARLVASSNIAAVKEAGGSVDRVSAILSVCDVPVLSGDDSLTLPMMSVGAMGVVSVISNLIPEKMLSMVNAFHAGDIAAAMAQHKAMYPCFKDMFVETNPIPIKAAMAMLGLIEEEYRLPICRMSNANREKLYQTLVEAGILS